MYITSRWSYLLIIHKYKTHDNVCSWSFIILTFRWLVKFILVKILHICCTTRWSSQRNDIGQVKEILIHTIQKLVSTDNYCHKISWVVHCSLSSKRVEGVYNAQLKISCPTENSDVQGDSRSRSKNVKMLFTPLLHHHCSSGSCFRETISRAIYYINNGYRNFIK